jgi:hypothetical protein
MELPIALVGLAFICGFAWSSPELAAVVFVIASLVAGTVSALAVLARHGRR